ncbi:MAG: LPS assembly protein LptD [Gammaproteobacteria bacterium]|nr:LPS assembly protein LptD [Gammaproteobacteria bacterium]
MRRALLTLMWAATAVGAAEPEAPAAPAPVYGCAIPAPAPLAPRTDVAADIVDVLSGDAEVDLNGPAIFRDRLVLRRDDIQLGADGARYDRDTGEFELSGNIELRNADTWLGGDSAGYNTESGLFRIDAAEFELHTLPARGSADRITLEETRVLTLTDATYTSCARGKDDWLLRAGSLSIDRETGVGTARNARLEFKGVPILYSPWLTYPVDGRRRSGLLLPDFGSGGQRGVEVAVPYYFNLAPNYDATLTPHYMSKRGLQARGEFRYLSAGSTGVLDGEFLPDDEVTGEDRTLVHWYNRSQLGTRWRATVDGTEVSDSAYFEDLSTGLGSASQTHLRQHIDFEYFDHTWSALIRLEDYQTLDDSLTDAEQPYQRLPHVAVNGYWPDNPLGLEYRLQTDLSYFHRDTGTTGLRTNLRPQVALPVRLGALSVDSSVAFDYTAYSLDETAPGAAQSPSRSLPIYSVSLATLLERAWGREGAWLQSIEPRVQFVHVPYEDQGDMPVFDTIQPDFDVVQLFRTNRYVGLDRLGDTDQLNMGITTRLMRSADGSQVLTATVGETRYFSSRDVTLPDESPTDDDSSDYIAELGMNINNRWNLDLGYQWDSDENVTRMAEARVMYKPADNKIVNLSYRFRRDSLREIDITGTWPIADRWSFVGRYDYSLLDNQVLESFFGLEYSTCCWGLRLVTERHLTSRDGDSDTAITLQLLLKGFGSPGSRPEQLLDRGTLGYDRY